MPPELLAIVTNWGAPALILFGILYRADQTARALLPIIIEHFEKLGEAMDAMKAAVSNLTTLTNTVGAIGTRIEECSAVGAGEHASIHDDTRHIRAGVEELLVHARTRHTDREAS
jgi:hypothetical protein